MTAPTPGGLPTRRAAVATLIGTTGSSPRTPGARMWVDEDGSIVGAVTIGGCVDARVVEAAQEVLVSGEAQVVEMSLGEADAAALGMTCAGSVELLIEPVAPVPTDPVTRGLEAVRAVVDAGRAVALVIDLSGSRERLLVHEDGTIEGTLGGGVDPRLARELAQVRLRDRVSGIEVVAGSPPRRLYVEVHAPAARLVIFGATHVAQPLAELARVLGLWVVVVDGRERYATTARFPSVDEVLVGMPSDIAGRLTLHRDTMVVLLSHDYKYDLPVLRRVLESEAGYIGCLGSTRRGQAMREFLADQGVSAASLARVRMPVGLDIGARTPAEIALSVLAEGLASLRGRPGGAMRDRPPREPGAGR
ncbi:MAG: XdhC family protein [Gemmatimonadetes bacterium]|nr:XdhC family protein [Gemmatimonadota bacterium]